MSEPVIRVLIADDQLLMRDGLASLLNIQPGIDVVGTAENGQEAITAVADLLPDVVLMDVRMPVMDGIELLPVFSVRHCFSLRWPTTSSLRRRARYWVQHQALSPNWRS